MEQLIKRLPPFVKRYPPCTVERFEEIIQQAMEDPALLLHRRVIIFHFDEEDGVFDFCFTRIESVICDCSAYLDGDQKLEQARRVRPMLHLYAHFGTTVPDEMIQCQQSTIYIDTDQCFTHFIEEVTSYDRGGRMNIPGNYYLYALLP